MTQQLKSCTFEIADVKGQLLQHILSIGFHLKPSGEDGVLYASFSSPTREAINKFFELFEGEKQLYEDHSITSEFGQSKVLNQYHNRKLGHELPTQLENVDTKEKNTVSDKDVQLYEDHSIISDFGQSKVLNQYRNRKLEHELPTQLENVDTKEKNTVSDKDVQPGDEEKVSTFILKTGEYAWMMKQFQNTAIFRYLKSADNSSSPVKVEVKGEKNINMLKSYKQKLKRMEIPIDRTDLLKKIEGEFKSVIHVQELKDNFILTTTKKVCREINKILDEDEMDSSSDTNTNESDKNINVGNQGGISAGRRSLLPSGPGDDTSSRQSDQRYKRNTYVSRFFSLIVEVMNEDITRFDVDVIVNAANKKLRHGGGVAKAISDAAGEEMNVECTKYISEHGSLEVSDHFSSSGGDIAVKQIYHAVGPRWSDYEGTLYGHDKNKCKQDLRLTILKCLIHAEIDGYRSIAFPSISAARFGVPQEICVNSYRLAVQHFAMLQTMYVMETLQKVYFVDIDDSLLTAIKHEFDSNWDNDLDYTKEFKKDRMFADDFLKKFKSFPTSSGKGGGHVTSMASSSWRHTSNAAGKGGGHVTSMASSSWRQTSNAAGKGGGHVTSMASTSEPHTSNAAAITQVNSTSQQGARPKDRKQGSSKQSGDLCTICYDPDNQNFMTTPCCRNKICRCCQERCAKCPYCKKVHGILTGDMPDNMSMEVNKRDYQSLPGEHGYGYYYIRYLNNRRLFREAYIPNTESGFDAVLLLGLAFYRRLTFTIGTSRTTGVDNRITWNDIHHKTSLEYGSPFGYPDPQYMHRLFDELTSNGVTFKILTQTEESLLDEWEKNLKAYSSFRIDEVFPTKSTITPLRT